MKIEIRIMGADDEVAGYIDRLLKLSAVPVAITKTARNLTLSMEVGPETRDKFMLLLKTLAWFA